MSDFKTRLEKIRNENRFRQRLPLESAQDTLVNIKGKLVINFASNNYLNLANNKHLKNSFKKSIEKYGIGSGSSPLISGYNKEYENF